MRLRVADSSSAGQPWLSGAHVFRHLLVLSPLFHWTQARLALHHSSRTDSHRPREIRQVAPFLSASRAIPRAQDLFSLFMFVFPRASSKESPACTLASLYCHSPKCPPPSALWAISARHAAKSWSRASKKNAKTVTTASIRGERGFPYDSLASFPAAAPRMA